MAAIRSHPQSRIRTDVGMEFWEIAEYVGEALVFIGVMGEVFAEWPDTNKLSKASSLVLIVGLALSLAALVNTNSRFNLTIAGLNNDTANASALAFQNALDEIDALGYAAKLQKEAEVEHLARLRVEEAVEWRRLTKSQIADMGTVLSAYPNQLTALVYNVNDVEAYGFAMDIDTALHEIAHWNVGEPQSVLMMREGPVRFGTNPPLETGVQVRSTMDERSTAASQSVINQLSKFGFDALRGEAIKSDKPTVQVLVEPRPEGPQGEAKLRRQKQTNKKK